MAPRQTGTRWRGAGGRWLIWVFRVVFWAVLLLIGYRGVMAIVLNETPPGSHRAPAAVTSARFPTASADAFALAFGQAYLNASPSLATQRAQQLAQFLPPGADPQLGWNGSGSMQLQSEQLAGTEVRDAHHAVVLVLGRVNGRLMELGVPVYAANGGMSVSGEPAWLPVPPRAVPPSQAVPAASDAATQSALMSQLPAFFQAYASGDEVTLARFVAPGAVVTGLGGEVTFQSLTGVAVPPGGTTRHVVATVVWRIPGQPAARVTGGSSDAGFEMAYALTVVKQNGTWYVQSISTATLAAVAP